ncbi:MAG TPA: Spy/CpxP family protein refolding chaperone [Candidatus Eisenbacteria bacterium]|nr:Spy/CpxP family protein refolding chaperone [Candidatus Eisenbacteria bacterium]
MKANRWAWIAALALVCALALTFAMPRGRAIAQTAPPSPQAPGPAGLEDQDAPPPPDDGLAWLGGDDGPGGDALEAPHGGGPDGGRMGRGGPGMCGPGRGRGMRDGMGMGFGALDLSSDQKKRLADIRDRQQRSAIRSQADLRIAELDLRKLMRADTPDRRAIESQLDKIGSMRTAMQKSRVGMMFDMRSVLTQEQRDQWKDWRENGGPHRERHGSSGSSESD